MELLFDEMHPDKLAQALRDRAVDAATVAESGMAGRSEGDVFASAGPARLIRALNGAVTPGS